MSVHLHTTITKKTDDILEELARNYGTKNRVLEKALETFLRVEKIGSCDDCAVRASVAEQTNLRQVLDLTSVRRKTLDGLLEVGLGDKTIDDFIQDQKTEAGNTIEILKRSSTWRSPSTFKDFVLILQEIQNLTRMFDVASHNEIDSTAILRPRTFKRLPEILAFQVASILEGIEAPFDLRVMGEDIAIKMIRPEVYSLRKREFDELLNQQIERRLANVAPSLFRNSLMLVGPAFMTWAEKHLEEPVTDLGSVMEDLRIVLGVDELPKEPKDFVRGLLSACIRVNWFKQAKILTEKGKNTLELVFQATTPAVARISVAAFSVMLASRGWKLVAYSVEHTTVNMTLQYVGAEDQSILDQLAELSLFQTIAKQFLDVIPIPRELFDSFASKTYEAQRQRFDDAYQAIGVRIANAIRILARNDPQRIQRFLRDFILKNISATQPDAEVRFVDDEHVTMIFKRIDPLVMNGQRMLTESMFKKLGYEVSSSVFQNLLSFTVRLSEKPPLEPVSRKKIVQALIDGMSCDSAEEAFAFEKAQLEEVFPEDYPWTITEVGDRLTQMYREIGIDVEIEYFEGGFTLKYRTCPYYKLVKSRQKTWLCNVRKDTIEYVISRVTHGKQGKVKIIRSLLQNEHPCEYAVFLTGFLEKEQEASSRGISTDSNLDS
jgi:hypothetical protein